MPLFNAWRAHRSRFLLLPPWIVAPDGRPSLLRSWKGCWASQADSGQIVGWYQDAGGTHGFLVTPVP
jgi:hypothetical protein